MGILINQGVQDTTQDNKFDPIVEKNVLAQITEIKLADAKKMPNTLEITFRILKGTHKSRFFWDRVTFDPNSDFSWKYRSLRKAAGVPYSETEPKTIDIEKLLLNKAVLVDLGIRVGKNKNHEDVNYQNVTYKVAQTDTQTDAVVDAQAAVDFEDVVDEPKATQPDPKPEPKPAKTAKPKPAKPAEVDTPQTPATPEPESIGTVAEIAENVVITDDDDWAD